MFFSEIVTLAGWLAAWLSLSLNFRVGETLTSIFLRNVPFNIFFWPKIRRLNNRQRLQSIEFEHKKWEWSMCFENVKGVEVIEAVFWIIIWKQSQISVVYIRTHKDIQEHWNLKPSIIWSHRAGWIYTNMWQKKDREGSNHFHCAIAVSCVFVCCECCLLGIWVFLIMWGHELLPNSLK